MLVAAPPVTATRVINFEMNAAAPEAALTLNELTVGPELKAVDIDSTGLATANVITEALNIADNINVTGATHLTLGEVGFAYQLPTGVIDASGTAAGGGVTAFLFSTPGSATAQTFLAGPTGTTNEAVFTNVGGGLATSRSTERIRSNSLGNNPRVLRLTTQATITTTSLRLRP